MSEMRHTIKAVSCKTGLTPHVIRIWERRYKAVEPARTGTNRRLYSDDDVIRLGLLRRATEAGHSISNVAGLTTDVLMRIAAESATPAEVSRPTPGENRGSEQEQLMEECLTAVRELDTRKLEDALSRAALIFGQHGMLERVVGPLTRSIGELWREGDIMSAHEHFASAAIRNFLGRNSAPFAHESSAPVLVVATPSGQLHELGAVIVAAAARDVGWQVIYLGPSLPAAEIASAAVQNKSRAVALSLVYPEDDPRLSTELENLRRYLPADVKILVGGRAAGSYRATLEQVGALVLTDLSGLYSKLEELRRPAARKGN